MRTSSPSRSAGRRSGASAREHLRPHFHRELPQISTGALTLFAGLLVVPVMAGVRLAAAMDWRLLFGGVIFLSAVTFLIYRRDKHRAANGGWRTPEATLHLLELIGGWPAAFLAQRFLRHKIVKLRYQIVFWGIILMHQAVELDFLRGWKTARRLLALLHA